MCCLDREDGWERRWNCWLSGFPLHPSLCGDCTSRRVEVGTGRGPLTAAFLQTCFLLSAYLTGSHTIPLNACPPTCSLHPQVLSARPPNFIHCLAGSVPVSPRVPFMNHCHHLFPWSPCFYLPPTVQSLKTQFGHIISLLTALQWLTLDFESSALRCLCSSHTDLLVLNVPNSLWSQGLYTCYSLCLKCYL